MPSTGKERQAARLAEKAEAQEAFAFLLPAQVPSRQQIRAKARTKLKRLASRVDSLPSATRPIFELGANYVGERQGRRIHHLKGADRRRAIECGYGR